MKNKILGLPKAAVIVIGKHKDNIGRLLRGEEKPITREKR